MANKKLFYGIIIAIVLVSAAGSGLWAHARSLMQARQVQNVNRVAYQVFNDLFALNSNAQLQLSPEQANAMLPLLEQFNTTDVKSAPALARQVYALLNPLQYKALLGRGEVGSRPSPKAEPGWARMRNKAHTSVERDQALRMQALPDLVIKQLQAIATGQAVPRTGQTGANQAPPGQAAPAPSGNGPAAQP